jgi:hypothetical protein
MGSGSPKNFLIETDASFSVSSTPSENMGLVIGGMWGPANQILAVTSKKDLVDSIGTPILTGTTGANCRTWMVCREILNNYSNSLYVVRAVKDDNTTKNAFIGITRDKSTHIWVNGADQLRYLNDDDAEPTVYMNDVRLKMPALTDFAVGDAVTQATSGAQGTISYLDATNVYMYIRNTNGIAFDATHAVTNTGTGSQIPVEVRTFSGQIRLTIGAAEAETFEVGLRATQLTSLATGIVVGIDKTNQYVYIADVEGEFVTTGGYTVSDSGSGATAAAPSAVDSGTYSGVYDVLGIYGVYSGVNGNSIKVAIADANEYHANKTYDGTNTFKGEFAEAPNTDYNYVEEVIDIVAEDVDPAGAKYETVSGNRYALTTGSGAASANWDGAGAGDIVEWNGAAWVATATAADDFFYSKNDHKHYVASDALGTYTSFAPELAVMVVYDDEIKEKWIVATDENALTDESEPMFIDEFLENNSNWVRSSSRTSAGSTSLNESTIENFNGYFEVTLLAGGASVAPTVTEMKNAIDEFYNDDIFNVRIIGDNHDLTVNADRQTLYNHILARNSTYKYQFGVGTLPDDVIDMSQTSDSLRVADAITYLAGITVETRGTMVDQWKKITDEYNYKKYYIPCTGDVMGLIARTSTDSGINKSPAGTRRGIVQNASRLMHKTTPTVRDLLFDNRSNSIFYMRNKGTLLWGDITLTNKPTSSLSTIQGRRTLTQIEADVMNALIDFNFEESNAEVWEELSLLVDDGYLALKKTQGWLYDYRFQCDDKNNPEEVQDNFEMYIDCGIKLYKNARYIYFRVKVYKNSVSFEEVG